MARQQQKQLTPKQQALRDLEDARASLAHHATLAVEEWSPRAMIVRSFEKHSAWWIGGAALAGLAVMKLLWPSSSGSNNGFLQSAKKRGLLTLLLSPMLALVRKNALSYASEWFESYLHRNVSPNAPDAGTV